MNKFTRIMDSTWKEKKWDDGDEDRKLTKLNSHWGQLKLFYAELEFLNICHSLTDSVVIYVGAAPGTHINYLIEFYNNLHWILIDPNPFHIQENSYIKICNEYFTDKMIPELLNHDFVKTCKHILFISDIRTNPIEDVVFKEMLDQQRWLLKLNADMSMLKFRLPYTLKDKKSEWGYDFSDIKKYIKLPRGRPPLGEHNMCYLKGDIYMQIYPPSFSTETRLIINKSDNFKMCYYNTLKYEGKCFYYNIYTRNADMTYKLSAELKKHIIGCKDTYETCSIYYIIEQYFKNRGDSCSLLNICTMLYKINRLHSKIFVTINNIKYVKSLGMIIMYTCYEKIKSEEKYAYNYNRDTDIYKTITATYESSMSYNLQQIEFFRNGTLLSKLEYDSQIKRLELDNRVNHLLFKLITDIHNKTIQNVSNNTE